MFTDVESAPTIESRSAHIRHFEEFVNRQNLDIADVNFAPDFVDHGRDVPPGMPPGAKGAKQYVGSALKKFPDMRVTIEDVIVEGDKWLCAIPGRALSCLEFAYRNGQKESGARPALI